MNVSSSSSGACRWLAAIVTVGIGCVDSGLSISVVWLLEVSGERIQFTVTHLAVSDMDYVLSKVSINPPQ